MGMPVIGRQEREVGGWLQPRRMEVIHKSSYWQNLLSSAFPKVVPQALGASVSNGIRYLFIEGLTGILEFLKKDSIPLLRSIYSSNFWNWMCCSWKNSEGKNI